MFSSVHWTNHILQGTRKLRSCLTSLPVFFYDVHMKIKCLNEVKSLSINRKRTKKDIDFQFASLHCLACLCTLQVHKQIVQVAVEWLCQ